jgi:membrane fusion protein
MLDLQLAEADAQETSLAVRRTALMQSIADERSRLSDQIAANVRTRAAMVRQRNAQAEALVLAEADAERLGRLQVQGYAPNAQVDARRRVVLTERAVLADLDTNLSTLDAAMANLRGQVAALPARSAETVAGLDAERSNLAQRRAELQVARGYVLRAPVAGAVSSLQARAGLTPSGDQPLLSIAPQGSPLEARLLVPTRAAGFLQVGQPARLQIEAFPFQRFGFVEGKIVDISRTVTRPDEALFPIAFTEPVYEVRVLLKRSYVDAYGKQRALQPGMSLRADLPIDRRRLWQQLFDPLLAAGKRAA